MKKYILYIVIGLTAFSCNSNSGNESEADGFFSTKKKKTELEKKVTKRDFTITPQNAYNNLFLDSTEMEKFFVDNNVSDSLIRRMRSFYNSRNYQYAWFSPEGVTEQGRGFWNMFLYYDKSDENITANAELKKKMHHFVMSEDLTVKPGDKSYLNTELMLTKQFIEYSLQSIEDGYIKRKEMERFVPQKKSDAFETADSLANKKHKDEKYYSDINPAYGKLMEELKKHVAIVKNGGFTPLPGKAQQYGKSAPATNIVLLKKRLAQSGDLSAEDSSAAFTPQLESAIHNFQSRHGYSATGILTDAQLKDINITADARIQQLLINLGRMQWMINKPSAKMMMVNIPEFILHVKENEKDVFKMNVVVGKEGHNTMIFTGSMNQVVFSPYWNVPPEIVEREIVPAMQRNPNYIAEHNMEITSKSGSLPVVRQLPGPGNSLGKVKFLFPNNFDIYFHDTNAKSLFSKDKRAFSHGCIRLSDPEKLANYVLKDQPEWTPERVMLAMNSGEEKYVKIKDPIHVIITYYTAWVDENGMLNFRDDIYGHDKKAAKKMFNNPLL